MPKTKREILVHFITVGVPIINYGNNMDQFYNIKDIVKGSINKCILYQISIIVFNDIERNMSRGSKRRLLCQMGWCQPPPLILYLFLFPHIITQSCIIGLKSLSLGFLFIFFDWSRLEGVGRIFCCVVWMILSILEGLCNGIWYVYLYFSMINNYFLSS